jgi:hypothetical protein
VVQALAPKYFNTRFLRVFVENVPFLVEKLGLKVLPCVICFVKGVAKDRYVRWLAVHDFSSNTASRIVGFEELGNADSFSTATLELRLLHTGSIFSSGQKMLFKYIIQGVIQKDHHSGPVVNSVSAVPAHGTRLRQDRRDDDDDFDL